MIITMKKNTSAQDIAKVMDQLKAQGLQIHESIGENYNVFGVVGDTSRIDPKRIEANPHVDSVVRVSSPYKKASRLFHPEDVYKRQEENNFIIYTIFLQNFHIFLLSFV